MTNKSAIEQIKYMLNHRDGRFIELTKADERALARAIESLENEDKISDVIRVVGANYKKAEKLDYISKPKSFALYQTWKEFDAKEKCRCDK